MTVPLGGTEVLPPRSAGFLWTGDEAVPMGKPPINNAFYDELGDRWYTAQDDPVALLRTEANFRNPRLLQELKDRRGEGACSLLDIGCGGGFLTNYLAQHGIQVTGVDLSEDSLAVARRFDKTGTVVGTAITPDPKKIGQLGK